MIARSGVKSASVHLVITHRDGTQEERFVSTNKFRVLAWRLSRYLKRIREWLTA